MSNWFQQLNTKRRGPERRVPRRGSRPRTSCPHIAANKRTVDPYGPYGPKIKEFCQKLQFTLHSDQPIFVLSISK